MKTIYLTRQCQPLVIQAPMPGDSHIDPVRGECRRLTAKRFCLAAERAGKDSDALTRLLDAISEAAENGCYDGRKIRDWYGLVGREMPKENGDLIFGVCRRCRAKHWYADPALAEICFDCWVGPLATA